VRHIAPDLDTTRSASATHTALCSSRVVRSADQNDMCLDASCSSSSMSWPVRLARHVLYLIQLSFLFMSRSVLALKSLLGHCREHATSFLCLFAVRCWSMVSANKLSLDFSCLFIMGPPLPYLQHSTLDNNNLYPHFCSSSSSQHVLCTSSFFKARFIQFWFQTAPCAAITSSGPYPFRH